MSTLIPPTDGASPDQYKELPGTFHSVLVTVPTPFIRNIEILNNGQSVQPIEPLFRSFTLYKMMLKFREAFWQNPGNNKGGFTFGDDAGMTLEKRGWG